MTKHPTSQLFLPLALLIGALGLIGCGTPVETLTIDAPDSLAIDETGTFSASVNEDAKPPIEYAWTFDNQNDASGSTVSQAFSTEGTHSVEVTASNRKGKRSVTESTSVVVYRPPVPAEVVTISANPMNPDTRTAVNFTSNVRGDTPLTYEWEFGDGSTGSGESPSHTYSEPGSYTVTLNASNEAGSDSRTLTLNVRVYEAPYCATVSEMNAAFFDRNASTLTAEARSALQQNLQILEDCPNTNVRIEGFAAPGERNVDQLSADRARAVEQYYTSNGVAASRLTTTGMGRVEGATSKKEGADQYRRVDSIPLR